MHARTHARTHPTPPHHRDNAFKLWRKLIQGGARTVEEAGVGLDKNLVAMAKEEFAVTTSTVVKAQHSADQSTTKLLVKLQVRWCVCGGGGVVAE
jgi:adenine C2-methylase RlmN of 23S rRNA A2503 and tRNA A37